MLALISRPVTALSLALFLYPGIVNAQEASPFFPHRLWSLENYTTDLDTGQRLPYTLDHDGYALYGDIILGKVSDLRSKGGISLKVHPSSRLASQNRQKRAAVDKWATYWTNGIIPVSLANATEETKRIVRQTMHDMNARTNLRFIEIELTPENKKRYPDYLNIVTHPLAGGDKDALCGSSYIGRIGGAQRLILKSSANCENQETVLHELMHAAGFQHEHERTDRNEYITLSNAYMDALGAHYNTNKDGKCPEKNFLQCLKREYKNTFPEKDFPQHDPKLATIDLTYPFEHNATTHRAYDPNSIMHYRMWGFQTRSLHREVNPGYGRGELSTGDIASINEVYRNTPQSQTHTSLVTPSEIVITDSENAYTVTVHAHCASRIGPLFSSGFTITQPVCRERKHSFTIRANAPIQGERVLLIPIHSPYPEPYREALTLRIKPMTIPLSTPNPTIFAHDMSKKTAPQRKATPSDGHQLESLDNQQCLHARKEDDTWRRRRTGYYLVSTAPCDPSRREQRWKYNPSTKQLTNAQYPDHCLGKISYDGRSLLDDHESSYAALQQCKTSNRQQQWQWDPNVMIFHNGADNMLTLGQYHGNVTISYGGSASQLGVNNHYRWRWLTNQQSQESPSFPISPLKGKQLVSQASQQCLQAMGRTHSELGGTQQYPVEMNPCQSQQLAQRWSYNLSTKQLLNTLYPGYCLGKINATGHPIADNTPGYAVLQPCNTTNRQQQWEWNQHTMTFRHHANITFALMQGNGTVVVQYDSQSPNEHYRWYWQN